MLPSSLEYLTEQLHRLPGVGKKTAHRLAIFILRDEKDRAVQLADAIRRVHQEVVFCRICNNISEQDECTICRDPRRDRSSICVVEDIVDVMAIEKSNEYRGLYHVLGGVISPLAGITPDQLKISELVERVKQPEVNEVLLALNPSTEGEATMIYLSRILKNHVEKITRIASGIPVGSHLEYIDNVTIGRAIMSRREI